MKGRKLLVGVAIGGALMVGAVAKDITTRPAFNQAFEIIDGYEKLDHISQELFDEANKYYNQANHVQATDNLDQIVNLRFIKREPVPQKVSDLQILTYIMGLDKSIGEAKDFLELGNLSNVAKHLFKAEDYSNRLGDVNSEGITNVWHETYLSALMAAINACKDGDIIYADHLVHDAKFYAYKAQIGYPDNLKVLQDKIYDSFREYPELRLEPPVEPKFHMPIPKEPQTPEAISINHFL